MKIKTCFSNTYYADTPTASMRKLLVVAEPALVAQAYPDKKVFVLGCDEHDGNGTEEFTRRFPNLFNYTL